MLSKKHYEALAAIFRLHYSSTSNAAALAMLDEVVSDVAEYLAQDNERFDKLRFLKASGCPDYTPGIGERTIAAP